MRPGIYYSGPLLMNRQSGSIVTIPRSAPTYSVAKFVYFLEGANFSFGKSSQEN